MATWLREGCTSRSELEYVRFAEARFHDEEKWQECVRLEAPRRRLPLNKCDGPTQANDEKPLKREFALDSSVSDRKRAAVARALKRGNERQVNAIIRDLERRRKSSRPDAVLLNLLAAAYSTRATLSDHPYDLALALGRSAESLENEPGQLTALFNTAHFSHLLRLDNSARLGWRRYLSRDSISPWAREARGRLAELEAIAAGLRAAERGQGRGAKRLAESEELGAFQPQQARELVMEDLLPAWGREYLKGDLKEASRLLERAQTIAWRNRGDGADITSLLAIEHISQEAEREGNSIGMARLAAGYSSFGLGRQFDRRNEVEKAERHYATAFDQLQLARSPLSIWTEMMMASSRIGLDSYAVTNLKVSGISARARPTEMPALLGIGSWLRGIIHVRQGDYAGGLKFYAEAEAFFSAAGEEQNLGGVYELEAEAYRFLGQRVAQWDHLHAALTTLRSYPRSRRLHSALWNGAETAARDEEYSLAIQLHSEDVMVAQRQGDVVALIEAHLREGTTLAAANSYPKASVEIENARRLLPLVAEGNLSRLIQARVTFAAARIRGVEQPDEAIPALTEAITFYEGEKKPLDLLEALVARANCHIDIGSFAEAEHDLDRALSLVEGQARLLTRLNLSLPFENAVAKMHDLRLDTAVRRGAGANEVLGLIEQARTSNRPPLFQGEVNIGRLVSGLGPHTVFVEWFATRKSLIVIGITQGRVEMRVAELEAVETALERLSYSMAVKSESKAEEAARMLSKLVMPPVELEEAELIVLSTDKLLNSLPLALLFDNSGNKRLIEIAPITGSTSLGAYSRAVEMSRLNSPVEAPRILIVDGTSWSRKLFPDLKSLPEAKREQEEVAAMYPGRARLLGGADLGKESFRNLAAVHDIVHFSGHAIAARDAMEKSFLVFGVKAGEEMMLVEEVTEMKIPGARLMILAGCSTMLGLDGRAGGVQGLGGAFGLSGIPTVIGAIDEVEDEVAREFFVEFHLKLKMGLSAGRAVQETQLGLMRRLDRESRDTFGWALFQMSGPDVDF